MVQTKSSIWNETVLNSGISKVLVCHSLPKQFVQQHRNRQPKNGQSILANFLAFAQAVKKGNSATVHTIVNQLAANVTVPKLENKAVFLEEVANHLTAYFEPARIHKNHSIKNKVYPLVIKGKTAADLNYIIEADSFSNKSTVFSFTWQQQINQALEATGYKILTIWSRDWWRKPEEEARKLASRIIREEVDEEMN